MTRTGSSRLPDPATLAEGLGVGRAVIAATILAAPAPAARLLGADRATARRITWLTRMMGVRDGALGVGAVNASRRGSDVGAWLVAGAVADAVDSVALLAALRNGRVRGVLPAAIVAGAAGSAAVHLAAARARR